MRHTLRTLLLLALAGAVIAAAAYGAVHHHHHKKRHAKVVRDPGRLGPALFGFNDNSVLFEQTDPETAIARSVRAGANLVRYTVDWDYVEEKQGQFNWNGYDALYAAALAHHIRPVLVPAFAPAWARPLDLSCGPTETAHCHNPTAPKYDGAWASFVATLARRYPKAAAIEVWNEPNLASFWEQGPNPQRYAQILDTAYDSIKQAVPSMRVLGGALANSQFGGDGSSAYESYLTVFLSYKPRFDALAIHDSDTAGTDGNWFGKTLDIARSALDSHGYRGVPLWVTELGRSTDGSEAVSPTQQSLRLLKMLQILGARKDVKAALVHTLVPSPLGGPGTEEYGFATLNPDGTPKPAYCAIAVARRAPRPVGCR